MRHHYTLYKSSIQWHMNWIIYFQHPCSKPMCNIYNQYQQQHSGMTMNRPSVLQVPSLVWRTRFEAEFNATAFREELLPSYSDSKLISIWIGEPFFYKISTSLPVARELKLSSVQNLDHMLPTLQLDVDGCDALTRVNPGHCVLWLSAGHHPPDWSLSAQAWRALIRMVWEK